MQLTTICKGIAAVVTCYGLKQILTLLLFMVLFNDSPLRMETALLPVSLTAVRANVGRMEAIAADAMIS